MPHMEKIPCLQMIVDCGHQFALRPFGAWRLPAPTWALLRSAHSDIHAHVADTPQAEIVYRKAAGGGDHWSPPRKGNGQGDFRFSMARRTNNEGCCQLKGDPSDRGRLPSVTSHVTSRTPPPAATPSTLFCNFTTADAGATSFCSGTWVTAPGDFRWVRADDRAESPCTGRCPGRSSGADVYLSAATHQHRKVAHLTAPILRYWQVSPSPPCPRHVPLLWTVSHFPPF